MSRVTCQVLGVKCNHFFGGGGGDKMVVLVAGGSLINGVLSRLVLLGCNLIGAQHAYSLVYIFSGAHC